MKKLRQLFCIHDWTEYNGAITKELTELQLRPKHYAKTPHFVFRCKKCKKFRLENN